MFSRARRCLECYEEAGLLFILGRKVHDWSLAHLLFVGWKFLFDLDVYVEIFFPDYAVVSGFGLACTLTCFDTSISLNRNLIYNPFTCVCDVHVCELNRDNR